MKIDWSKAEITISHFHKCPICGRDYECQEDYCDGIIQQDCLSCEAIRAGQMSFTFAGDNDDRIRHVVH